MQQSVIKIAAGCNEQNVFYNNWLFELQPAVLLQFCNITSGFRQPLVADMIFLIFSKLDKSKWYDTFTYYVLSTAFFRH